jgi:hypothetical protein
LRGKLSHDKFAAKLAKHAAEMGFQLKPNRQTVIRWEAGKGISLDYAVVLADLDSSSPELFRPSQPSAPPPVHREIAGLRAEVAELRDDVSQIRLALEREGIAIV